MAGLVVNGGESLAAQYLVNKASPQNLVLRLFKSNTTPTEASVVGDLTEADFTGYSAITLTGATWSESGGVASYAQQTFTSSADQSSQAIYGAYTTRATGGELVSIERFGTAATVVNNGDTVKVTPSITVAGS